MGVYLIMVVGSLFFRALGAVFLMCMFFVLKLMYSATFIMYILECVLILCSLIYV